MCGNKPVDLSSDNENCGACGNKCKNTTCVNGKCDKVEGTENKILCGDEYINPDNDPRYCGAKDDCKGASAGIVCKSPTPLCSNGRCVDACVGIQIVCDGKCVDPQNDNAYCGASGNCEGNNAGKICASGEVCSEGSCGVTCVNGQVLCNGQCIDPQTDNRYCGAEAGCENYTECPSGNVCSGGACGINCVSGQIVCGGKCVDPQKDNTYCGAKDDCSGTNAGEACVSGTVCSEGHCGITCVSGQFLCLDKCIDPDSDNQYCGAQDGCKNYTSCPSGNVCSAGTCGVTCVSGQVLCKGQCIDPKTDNRYCGAKGKCNTASVSDANYRGEKCADGTKCTDRVCKISCVSGQIVCGNECIDPKTNPYYCGAKENCEGSNRGTDCTTSSTNKLCEDGKCTSSCPSGQTQCGAFCIDIQATHVTSCNTGNDGSYTITCGTDYGDCDKKAANGCEVNTTSDNAHCGGCNQRCTKESVANSVDVQCSNRGCKATSCARGYVLDNGMCKLSDTLDCCGKECKNCRDEYQNMKKGSCDANKSECSLIECNDGYMLNDTKTKCVAIECSSDMECGNSGVCKDGKCQCGDILGCSGNKPICKNGSCVACTSLNLEQCSSVAHALTICKDDNTCSYQCNTGYYDNNQNGCSENTTQNCGKSGAKCEGNTKVCKTDEGKCVECLVSDNCKDIRQGETPVCKTDEGKCVKCTSKSHCNTNGSGVCDTDTNTCVYTTCSEGYTLSEKRDSCVPTKTRCGTSATNCTNISNILNADSVSCVNGFCKVTSCKPESNTHVYNPSNEHGRCEENSKDHCGSHDYKCNDVNATNISCQSGFCKIEKCNDDYHVCTQKEGVDNGHDICHENTNDSCGAEHVKCSDYFTSDECIKGQCSGSSCKDGYTKCEKGNEALCLNEGDGWTGNSWPSKCSNCVGASNCSNGKTCKRTTDWLPPYNHSYSCE